MSLSCAVALATYNGKEFLKQQLQSLMNQTHKIDKVYICDDCSTDGTADLIKSFIRDNNLVDWDFEIQAHNVGCKANFAYAISKCDADVIFLCDQDDIWLENKVEVMLEVFEKYDNVKSLICGFKLIAKDDSVIIKKGAVDNPWFHDFQNKVDAEPQLFKAELTSVLGHCVGPGCAQAFRKELIAQFIKFDCSWPYHDYKISLLAAMADGLYFWNEALIYYRRHGNNAIGIPSFFISRKNNILSIPLYYIRILAADAVCLISKKHRNHLFFDMSGLIGTLDTMPLSNNLKDDYNEWKEFCEVRKKLYSANRKKNHYRKLQNSAYQKHYRALSYTNDPIENFQIFTTDILALMKH